ncbi:hypothetical protein C0J45_2327, partial [Silurus meridionalis]
VKMISWNVKGLNNKVKSVKVFSHLNNLKANVCFLQETHLMISRHKSLLRSWVGQVFHSGYNCKASGTAILINKNTPFSPSNVISDPNGRYVIVSGSLYNCQVTLASIYAPNFFIKLFSKLPDLNIYQLIMGGDFNCVLNTVLNKSSPKSVLPSQSSKIINSLLELYGITEVWHLLNPHSRVFSFFSTAHHTYTRIDYFFIDSKFIPSVKSSSYESIIISDHAPVTLELALPGCYRSLYPWKINVLLLSDNHFVQFLSEKISTFLEINSTEGISTSLLWETLKAYLRGEIISYSTHIKRLRNKRLLELSEQIGMLDQDYASHPTPSGKSPGPDGFPTEFFKKLSPQLSSLLLSVFEGSLNDGYLPPSLRQASISLLLKPDRNPLECGSYRSISLLNVDVNILAKVLSLRLETVIQDIIHPDQTGFIKNRQVFFYIRRLMNIIYTSSDSSLPEALVSLDVEKAFDRVEWDYLFLTLEKFGFGDRFVSWVKLLYSSPLASVRSNSVSSGYFTLYRGTRQGCPLSPLLFALAIEPLTISLRNNHNITGIIRAGNEQKISLYADDIVVYISDPESSLPHILDILNQFSGVSGYKLN